MWTTFENLLKQYCNVVGVLGNRVLEKVFRPKRDEVTGEWKRLRNEELYVLVKVKAKVKPTLYRPGQTLRVPGG